MPAHMQSQPGKGSAAAVQRMVGRWGKRGDAGLEISYKAITVVQGQLDGCVTCAVTQGPTLTRDHAGFDALLSVS